MALLEKLTLGGSWICELRGCMEETEDDEEWKVEVGGQWKDGGKTDVAGWSY